MSEMKPVGGSFDKQAHSMYINETVEVKTVNTYFYFGPVELNGNQIPGFIVDRYTGAVTRFVWLCAEFNFTMILACAHIK